MSEQTHSLEDIEQKIPHMQYVADCLVEGDLARLSHFDGLYPASMTFPEMVLRFSDSRAAHYCYMIALQDKAQLDVIERVHTLRDVFGFYANQVLGGQMSMVAYELEHQQRDVAVLFSLSHSFLLYAKALRSVDNAEDDVLLSRVAPLVSQQYDRYEEMDKTAKEADLKAQEKAQESAAVCAAPISEIELASASDRFEFVTMKCAHNDVRLAGANLDLFALLAQESYFWQKSLRENASLTLGGAVRPTADLEYQAGLFKSALERAQIYAAHGKKMFEISSLVVSRVTDIQNQMMAAGRSTGDGLPLYLPR